MRIRTSIVAVTLSLLLSASALGQLSGRHIPELTWADTTMLNFMAEHGVSGGLLGIMKDGCIVYQRGFGWMDDDQNITMPENALVRIASCTKPITAAAIQKLASEGAFGSDGLDRLAFNLGQANPGLLTISPWPSLGDTRMRNITIRHLLEHKGGWNRDPTVGPGDVTYMECTIAGDMGVDSPPGRTNTLRWILGQPLQFRPGSQQRYSNVGYLALGLIVEQVTGQSHITYLRENILTQNDWIPYSDFRGGRTFEAWQPVREAWYDGSAGNNCVFDNGECVLGCDTLITNDAYGSWDHEARIGQGGIVVSVATMLNFLERYQCQVYSPNIGAPLNGTRVNGAHNGALSGCNTYMRQRTDGINVFIFFNEDADGDGSEENPSHFGSAMYSLLDPQLTSQTNWPTLCIDGFWVNPTAPLPTPLGSYNFYFQNMSNALAELGGGSRLNCRPGNYNWNGTISTKLQLRAPLGAARIGD